MSLERRSDITSSVFRSLLILPLLILLFGVGMAQSSTDSVTPAALTPGSPAGSYPLGDFDTINIYNGHLNFVLPLLKMGGRGSAAIPIVYKHEQVWRDETITVCYPCGSYPTYNWWNDVNPVYGMGFLQARTSSEGFNDCFPDGSVDRYAVTRLTFSAADGTEYQLVEQTTMGKPLDIKGPTCEILVQNQKVFVTTDGSQVTFISDTPTLAGIYPTGYLMMKDGSRYRIENGYVKWVRDRNGNRVTITYGAPLPGCGITSLCNRPVKITDSLNREATIEYDVNDS